MSLSISAHIDCHPWDRTHVLGTSPSNTAFFLPGIPGACNSLIRLHPFDLSSAQWLKGRYSWESCVLFHPGLSTSEFFRSFSGMSVAGIGSWPNWGPWELGWGCEERRKERCGPTQLTFQLFSVGTSVFPDSLVEGDCTDGDEAGEAFSSVFYALSGVLAKDYRPYIAVWARVPPYWENTRQEEGPLW